MKLRCFTMSITYVVTALTTHHQAKNHVQTYTNESKENKMQTKIAVNIHKLIK
jgi:hypothetical protein